MEYKLGNSNRIYSQGETRELICPDCNCKVKFSVFTNFEARLIAKFPLLKTGNVYFAVCPNCASVFGIDPSKGHSFRNGEDLSIGNFDLQRLEKFDV